MKLQQAIHGAIRAVGSIGKQETEKSSERMSICRDCPQSTGVRCMLCGCIIAAKVKYPDERCPIEKW